jgi:hypothetical protein
MVKMQVATSRRRAQGDGIRGEWERSERRDRAGSTSRQVQSTRGPEGGAEDDVGSDDDDDSDADGDDGDSDGGGGDGDDDDDEDDEDGEDDAAAADDADD